VKKISSLTLHLPSLFYFCVDKKNEGMTVRGFIDLLLNDPLRNDVAEIVSNVRRHNHTPRPSGQYWEKTKRDVFLRDNGKCVYCGEENGVEVDHVIPFSLGGNNESDNLATSCLRCNRQKGSKTIDEWLGK